MTVMTPDVVPVTLSHRMGENVSSRLEIRQATKYGHQRDKRFRRDHCDIHD